MDKPQPTEATQVGGETALHQLGLDPQALETFTASLSRKPTDRRICTCGHPMIRHDKGSSGLWSCIWGRMWCPCQSPTPIIEAEDVRHFQTKTRGIAEKHALATGLQKTLMRGIATKFIEEPSCFKCGTPSNNLKPVGLSHDLKVRDTPSPYNGLFCEKCLLELMGYVVETTTQLLES